MINVEKVVGVDGKDYDLYTDDHWHELMLTGAVTRDDGTGYPVIIGKNGTIYMATGHSVFPLSEGFDGVIWYNK